MLRVAGHVVRGTCFVLRGTWCVLREETFGVFVILFDINKCESTNVAKRFPYKKKSSNVEIVSLSPNPLLSHASLWPVSSS